MLALPLAARTYDDKVAYCYRSKQSLIDWHNKVGAAVDQKDAKALLGFREWVRTEWEPRFKACMLTLHSLPGFSQLCPPELMTAQTKQAAIDAAKPADKGKLPQLTTAETSAVALIKARTDLQVAGTVDKSWDTFIDVEKFPRLGVMGEPPDPLEDFTTYTKVDPGGILTVTASKIAASGYGTPYVYKDKGAGHFGVNFTHLGKLNYGHVSSPNGYPAPWILGNVIAAWNGGGLWSGGGANALGFIPGQPGGLVYLFENDGGTNYYDLDASALTDDTDYWTKFVNDAGVGTHGTLYSYVYSDAGRSSLVCSEAVALHASGKTYRYIYAYNQDESNNVVATSENLDLGEVTRPLILGALQQSRIIGGGLR